MVKSQEVNVVLQACVFAGMGERWLLVFAVMNTLRNLSECAERRPWKSMT